MLARMLVIHCDQNSYEITMNGYQASEINEKIYELIFWWLDVQTQEMFACVVNECIVPRSNIKHDKIQIK